MRGQRGARKLASTQNILCRKLDIPGFLEAKKKKQNMISTLFLKHQSIATSNDIFIKLSPELPRFVSSGGPKNGPDAGHSLTTLPPTEKKKTSSVDNTLFRDPPANYVTASMPV